MSLKVLEQGRNTSDFTCACDRFSGLHAVVFRVIIALSSEKKWVLAEDRRVPDGVSAVGLKSLEMCAEERGVRGLQSLARTSYLLTAWLNSLTAKTIWKPGGGCQEWIPGNNA